MDLTNYWWQLIWVLLFGAVSLVMIPKRQEMVFGKPCMRWGRLSAFVLALPYVFWAAIRTNIYGDTGIYRSTFLNMPTGLSSFWSYVSSRSKGPLFVSFEYLFKTLLSDSPEVFFFAIALIQLVLLVRVYRKYSTDYWLSMFLFIASTDYMSWVHNGMRQFVAVVIIFACFPLLVERRYVLMCLVVLACALIHSSALIFLPFVFVINGRAWNYRTMLFIGALILSIIFLDKVTGFIVRSMEETVYVDDIDIFLKDDGTNILRVLFYSVPAIVSWLFRERIYAKNDPVINICANLSIIAAGVYVFSFYTSGLLVGALPIYFSLANYILIPWLIREIFTGESVILVEGGFIALYSYFFYYQMGVTWKLL